MLRITACEFLKSVADENALLSGVPQIVFAGKSNSGKSSLINMLCGNSKLAKVGQTPGLTQFVNFFRCVAANSTGAKKEFHLVDLPGYGYAKSGKKSAENFSRLVESFLKGSQDIRELFLLVDVRNGANQNDLQLIHFLNFHQIPFTVVATKADKLSGAQIGVQKQRLASDMMMGAGNIIVTSSENGRGRAELLSKIEQKLDA